MEVLAPGQAVLVRSGEERQRKAAALPMARLRWDADLGQAEPRHRHDLDPAGQRLGRLAQQHRRGAAQHQEPGGQGVAVAEDAQDREQVGPALDFVNHHHRPVSPLSAVMGCSRRTRLTGSSRSR